MKTTGQKRLTVRRVGKVLAILLGSVIGILLILFLILWLNSPGTTAPYLDEEGNVLENSVSEIVRMEIGGIEQGMILKGRNDQNPVLLFLHGGPGNPEYVLAREAEVGLEEDFTVCWWEQRGGGMSYSSNLAPVTLEQLIADTVEVTEYLRTRFGQSKIYLMGHSWGTYLGVQTASRYPELYSAYMGIGQISDQMQSEQQAYQYMRETFQEREDRAALKKLEAFQIRDYRDITPGYLALRSDLLNGLGNGVFHEPQSKMAMLLPIFMAHEYTLPDLYGYAMGSFSMLESPANRSCYTSSLMEGIASLDIPVYLFHGVYDKQVSYSLAKEYFDILQAPERKFYSFENSAHSPFLEEPGRFMELIRKDVLGGK